MSGAIHERFEIKKDTYIVDPRGLWTKIWDCFQYPWIPLAWSIISTLIIAIFPAFIPFALFIFALLWLAVITKPDTLPIHLPISANKNDVNDPKPGDGKGYYKARGSFYLGRIKKFGWQVWANFGALTQHFLILGTTGSGKTESIISYITCYLSVGSGVAFQDAKAAPKTLVQVGTVARIFGRDDDVRNTNYITGLTSEKRDFAERLSNDAAVFARGSADSNTQLLVSLMPPSEGENKLFSERAVALVSAVMPALTDLRELGKLQIDPAVLRSNMAFKNFVSLYQNNNITKRSRDALQAYLLSLPGYDEEVAINAQPEEVTRQFGFAQAYFTRSLSSLSDTYGHIYMVGQGEIDYQDVVLNGRILITLLPSMEKSGEELSNLGKIVLTATKNGMVVGLGTVFEGSAEDIVHNLPTNSEIPFGVINDENAYMLIEGQEILNAQARGLGFGIMTGTQDAPGMLENISKTTKQILANSAFKQIMYIDDKETTQLAIDLAGEADVLVRGEYERIGDMGSVFAAKGVRLESKGRISEKAIKAQRLGQSFLSYQGKVHEIQGYNHGIKDKDSNQLMRFIDFWYPVRMPKTKIPNEETILKYMKWSPNKNWEELLLMLRDDARQMLNEMTEYFSTQLIIDSIMELYKDQSSTILTELVVDDEQLIDTNKPTGLISHIIEAAPTSYAETCAMWSHLMENSNSGQFGVQKLAEASGLNAFDDSDQEDIDLSLLNGGGSTGSGGGSAMNAPPPSGQSALADFLGAEVFVEVQDDHSEQELVVPDSHLEESDMFYQATLEAPAELSPMATAVERSMSFMPWMASAVEYEEVKTTLHETELFFNGGDESAAAAAVNHSLSVISEGLDYPETERNAVEPTEKERLKGLLKSWINHK
ncbi:hypothetical protein [Pseudomonas sp. NPDC096950]|uniref:hypothetical protein n=1 Tax=Pseudomonas sp. NPDC096950 TaxID=3364485 RepID=UPI00383AA38D